MNKRITVAAFHDALERQLAGLQADPALAKRIISAEKKENKMDKKIRTGFVLVLASLFVLAAAAYAAPALYRVITWRGKTTRTEILLENTNETQQIDASISDFLQTVPDEQTVFAWYEDNDRTIIASSLHKMQKRFSTSKQFLQYLSDCQTLTPPHWLPDGELDYFDAIVFMDCKASGEYEQLAQDDRQRLHYTRFRIADDSAFASGYDFTLVFKDGRALHIQSNLQSAATSDEALLLNDTQTAQEIQIDGMTEALLITSSDSANPDGLIMRRRLNDPVAWKQLPYNKFINDEGDNLYAVEYISVWTFNWENAEELINMFSHSR